MYSSEQEVLTMLRIGMETQMYIIKGSVKAILKMLQLFKRMKKQKIISGKAYDNFERFLKDTKGDFQIMNVN